MNTWSYSRLRNFEECPAKYHYESIQKIPTPQHPAAKRGTQVHEIAENYINGKVTTEDCPSVLRDFSEAFRDLRKGYELGKVVVEEDWAFDVDWKPSPWVDPETWGRYKIDAYIKHDDYTVVIDFKTGRYAGNEESHEAQCALYAVATAHRFPEIENIQSELWYLDHNKITRHSYTRKDIEARKQEFTIRALRLTETKDFPATPSENACRWCHFGKAGICEDVYRNF